VGGAGWQAQGMDDTRADPLVTARALVTERFPGARAAFLAGSSTSATRSPTSDLDVVVVVGDDDPDAPFRETTGRDGWLVELFVHTPASIGHYRRLERESHRPVLDLMCACGTPLLGPDAAAVAASARGSLAPGPAVGPDEWERRRYVLTDLLDDLRGTGEDDGSGTAAERAFITSRLLEETAHAALLHRGEWVHTGKAAARALAVADPNLLTRLVDACRAAFEGQPQSLDAVVTEVLDAVGGPLREGYRAVGTRSGTPGRSTGEPGGTVS
jgi:hypothetical protein